MEGGKPLCWPGGLLLEPSAICSMFPMIVCLSTAEPGAEDEAEEEEEEAGLRAGGGGGGWEPNSGV